MLKVDDERVTTSLNDLKEYNQGAVVELPAFGFGQPFIARMRRPSMLELASNGTIPNALLTKAEEMFYGKAKPRDNKGNTLKEFYDICVIMAQACLVSPTFEQIKEANLALADDQLIAIFNYTQEGAKGLETFRGKQKSLVNNAPSSDVQKAPVGSAQARPKR